MEKNDSLKRALALSQRDQAIESFKDVKERLIFVYEEGPECANDIMLIKSCVSFVLGDVCISQMDQETDFDLPEN